VIKEIKLDLSRSVLAYLELEHFAMSLTELSQRKIFHQLAQDYSGPVLL
jgi:hypothetical protein